MSCWGWSSLLPSCRGRFASWRCKSSRAGSWMETWVYHCRNGSRNGAIWYWVIPKRRNSQKTLIWDTRSVWIVMFIKDTLYRDILSVMPIPTVDLLFLNSKNEILLWKRNNEPLLGVYYIPGGRVNKWEKSLDAASRKARDELGLSIDTSRLQFIGVYDDIFENSAFEDISTHCIPVTYLYKLSQDEEWQINISDSQHSDLRFFAISDPSLHEMVKIRIQDIQ